MEGAQLPEQLRRTPDILCSTAILKQSQFPKGRGPFCSAPTPLSKLPPFSDLGSICLLLLLRRKDGQCPLCHSGSLQETMQGGKKEEEKANCLRVFLPIRS